VPYNLTNLTTTPANVLDDKISAPSKSKEVLNLIATAILPIVGAGGTLFVFLAANYYVGDVQIVTANTFHTLEVHAYNQKGQEAVFHTAHFQLMPEKYHFEVIVDSQATQHADAIVQFQQTTAIKVNSPFSPGTASAVTFDQDNSDKKRHWWQFWRHAKSDRLDLKNYR
jgi:hypothetical protein